MKKQMVGMLLVAMLTVSLLAMVGAVSAESEGSYSVLFYVTDDLGDPMTDAVIDIYEIPLELADGLYGDLVESLDVGSNGTAVTVLEAGRYKVDVTYPGYTTVKENIEVDRNTTFAYEMSPSSIASVGELVGLEGDQAYWAGIAIIAVIVMTSGFVLYWFFAGGNSGRSGSGAAGIDTTALLGLAVVLVVVVGSLAYISIDPEVTEGRINRTPGSTGMVCTFSVEVDEYSNYKTFTGTGIKAATDLEFSTRHVGSSAPTCAVVTHATYDARVGNNFTVDSHGGDLVSLNGVFYESESTTRWADYDAVDGISYFGSGVDSAKVWWDSAYDSLDYNSTAIPFDIHISSSNPVTGEAYYSANMRVALRGAYDQRGNINTDYRTVVNVYVPFSKIAVRESIAIVTNGWDLGGRVEFLETSHTISKEWEYSLLWGLFSFTTEVSEDRTINDGTEGIYSWQDPTQEDRNSWFYTVL